jgi:cystathionine beta-lyase
MKYNFDIITPRCGTHCVKHDIIHLDVTLQQDPEVIPMWVADMDFPSPPEIIEVLRQRIEHQIFGYTNRPTSYTNAIIKWQKKRHGYSINPDCIEFSPCVMTSISYLIQQYTKEGDKVLIQTPVYPEFADSINDWHRVITENPLVEKNGHYDIDFNDFETKIKQGVKMFILCNPHNPVGRVWTKDELSRMANICKRHKVWVIADEIHADLILSGTFTAFATLPEAYDHTFTCISPTKTFNLAGVQASNLIFPNAEECNTFLIFLKKWHINRNGSFNLVMVQAAYELGEAWLEALLAYIRNNVAFVQNFLHKYLPKIKLIAPEATYLLWLDCRELNLTDAQLKKLFYEDAKIIVNMGSSFGSNGTGFVRMNIATPQQQVKTALKRLAIQLSEQKK